MKVAIATCRELPEPDVDEELLMSALQEAGIDATLAAWDDPSVSWDSYGLCVIRSTWNYPELPTAFKEWVRQAGEVVSMLNPPNVVQANVDKRYLADMDGKGFRVVPTRYVERTSSLTHLEDWRRRAFVVKPTISAGSWMTRKFSPDEFDHGMAFLRRHTADREMMVQPYLESVERGGEVAWIWVDGVVTHGVRKSPRFEDDDESVSEAVEPSDQDRALVDRVLSTVEAELLYARIDLIHSDGEMLLSELELIEPSLFLRQSPRALERLVAAIHRRIA